MNLISEKIKPILIGAIGLVLAIVLGFFVGASNYFFLVCVALLLAGSIIWFGTGYWFWLLTVASSYLGGTFPILQGSFTPFQILMVIGVAKFFVEDVIMRRVSFARVDRSLLWALAGFMMIITVHGIHDRFGMRFLGSNVWGGRNYVNVYIGLIAFFVIQSIAVKPRIWNKLPYLVLAVTSFDLLIGIVTTIFPSSIYKIYPFYSAVGVSGISELTTGHESVTDRIGTFGNFGYILFAIVLAAVPLSRLFSPGNLPRLFSAGIASIAVIYSGYRSAVANFLFTFMVAGFRDLRFGVLAALPIIAALLFGLSAVNSSVVELPKQMQRALVFLPGDWNSDMVRDARDSNEFRAKVWSIWLNDFFPRQPLLGRGFGFRSEWTQTSAYHPEAVDYEQMVEVGNIHNGLFASVDAVGIVGTFFFVVWNMLLLWRAILTPFDRDDQTGFVLRFLALQLAASILCYWFGAITLGTFLPQEFALAGLFLKLHRSSPARTVSVSSSLPPLDQRPQRTAARV